MTLVEELIEGVVLEGLDASWEVGCERCRSCEGGARELRSKVGDMEALVVGDRLESMPVTKFWLESRSSPLMPPLMSMATSGIMAMGS